MMSLSGKLKLMFQQSVTITTGILIVFTLQTLLEHLRYGNKLILWYYPLSILVVGVVCSLPTVFLLSRDDLPGKVYRIRIILHCIIMYAIVMGSGFLFHWYTTKSGFISVSISYILVYVFVWLSSLWIMRGEDKQINNALKDIQDEE